jgi:DNA primase
MDVVALAQHGVGNALATLGTATTREQVQKLFRQVDSVVFCFDGDMAGHKAAWRALENVLDSLTEQKSISFAFLPDSEDPDSFIRKKGKAAFDNLIREAVPLSSFLIGAIIKRCDLTSAEGCTRLIAEAKPLLTRIPIPLLRLQIAQRLASESGFPLDEIKQGCGIKSSAPKALLAKPKRQTPSLQRTLVRLALQHPVLVERVPLELVPLSRERIILEAILESLPRLPPTPSYTQLREQLREHPLRAELDALAGEGINLQLTEDKIEHEFLDAVARLRDNKRQVEFADLQKRASQFGISGLTSAEKERYNQLLLEKCEQTLPDSHSR